MLFLVRNDELIRHREKTYLTAGVAVAGTTLTVQAVDANAWADDDFIIVGEIGSKTAELLQINGAVTDGTSLTIDQSGSSGARYVHSVDEPVYRIDYNQIEFSRATTATGTKTVRTSAEIQPDDLFTRYEDSTFSTGFGFVRFKRGSNYSEFSAPIPYTGYTPKSLGRIIKMIRRHLDEPDFRQISDEDIIEEVNEKQRDVAHERLWPFYEDTFSDSTVAYQNRYDIDDDVTDGQVHTVVVRATPMAKIDEARRNMLQWDTATTGDPTHYGIWKNKIGLWPNPSDAANADELDGDVAASDTTIELDDASGFSPSGRITIDSEIISYTHISDGTDLNGCVRGLEESTAATHSDGATVTERDIIYASHREPNELADISDETNIPDPLVLVYGVAMEIALGKLGNPGLHDRLKLKYDQAISRLRDKFGRKGTAGYYRIKDKDDVISDVGRFVNPNDFPTNISAG